jgi:hypothetical protein
MPETSGVLVSASPLASVQMMDFRHFDDAERQRRRHG